MMRNGLCLILTGLTACAGIKTGDKTLLESSRKTAQQIARPFMEKKQVWGAYYIDLTWEAMLRCDQPEFRAYVLRQVEKRGWTPETVIPYEKQPFCHVNYLIGKVTGEQGWLDSFAAETMRYRSEAIFTPEGAITLRDKNVAGNPMLIDLVQDYASRLAQTAAINGDATLYKESVAQFRIYRQILRDPANGLYSQGRGFLDNPAELSPGAWSRGHGWLMRGMVESLAGMPPDSAEYKELRGYLRELADALLAVQDNEGMWHQLLDKPFEDSFPETSGTAMISYNLARAWKLGALPEDRYRAAAVRSFEAVARRVGEDGRISGTCKAPGPLRSINGYLRTPGEPDDPHGHFAALFACAGISLIR
jgi:hypothetical protein